ncbi:GreA/GreB family elongation factor [Sphingomonas sp. BK235]|jgi:transcription elongation GreA/GreB family factor|uniref:GreA/GreB family elongation factor n=1 Tax=Sphingomonas sp. BK235 TaxID=2512131 RepID=UPI0010511FD3|nr:GreA/GreB family elongation factor [Sphingomonas sp. BK235]TCP33816.1 transcription elongation GreA/GreB family factor [Sphingomonas sp. BK235]
MSVAFRRESDDEHLEPRFELPIPPGPNLVTARGRVLIDERIAALEAALDAADDEEARKAVARDLRYWKTRRATAIETAARDDGVVGFGTAVTFTLDGRERVVTIVGDDEADPAAGLLALSAPLARALLGASAGEWVAFNGREDVIEVLRVG